MLYAVAAFWLSSLFALSLKLNTAIPTAFAGANLQTPQWAGSLIVLSTLTVVLAATTLLIAKLYQDKQTENLAPFTVTLVLICLCLVLVPTLLNSYQFFVTPQLVLGVLTN